MIQHGPICLGVQGLASGDTGVASSEDCLFIDVYAPSSASRTSDSHKGLPVLLWIQGGAFVQLFNPNYNGTGLVKASNDNVIIVSFNYRVGPYGFLASEELENEGNLNAGFHDQRAAMHWVQNNIAHFGGDPDRVTLFGTSIGGGSVLLQSVAYGGQPQAKDDIKWSAGIAEAVYIPPIREVQDGERQYKAILNATGCHDLACLRSLDSKTIQNANHAVPFDGQSEIALFPYFPVIDGTLFKNTTSNLLASGMFATKRPLIIGSSYTEGTAFAPQANTTSDVKAFLQVQYPDLTDAALTKGLAVYKNAPSTIPGSTVASAPFHAHLAYMFGDVGFSSPALGFAKALSEAGGKVHLFRDHILDPVEVAAGFGVPHTWEVQAVWGPAYAKQYAALPGADSYNPGKTNHGIVSVVQKYWINFALSGGNPNSHKTAHNPSLPFWHVFDIKTGAKRLKLQTNNTIVEPVRDWELERLDFWLSVADETHV